MQLIALIHLPNSCNATVGIIYFNIYFNKQMNEKSMKEICREQLE